MTKEQLLAIVEEVESNPVQLLVDTLNLLKNKEGFEQDLLTPGFIKEWMVSKILGHSCHKTKHGPDATSLDGTEHYEYLSCKEGGSFQLDRIHEGNLHRIERNNAFYFAQFNKEDGLKCQKIWKGDTEVVLAEAREKIGRMSESSKHIGFSEEWVSDNCEVVYPKPILSYVEWHKNRDKMAEELEKNGS
jgi:hypothetical protein